MNPQIILIPHMNFWSVLLLICAGQAFFLAVILLFHKKGNTAANKILSLLIFCFSYYFIFIAAYWSNYLIMYPHLLGTLRILNFSWGPLFYLYVTEVLQKEKKFNLMKLLHFLPAFISVGITVPIFLLDPDAKIEIIKRMLTAEYSAGGIYSILPSALFNIHIMLYTILTIKKIHSYSKKLNGGNNSLAHINYNWLLKLSFGFAGFFLSWFIYEILMTAGVKYNIEVDYAITFFGVVVVYTIAYYSMKQPEIFSGLSIIKNDSKYEKSVIPAEDAEDYITRLKEVMEKEKLFLNSEFNLKTLADILNITPHKLSQLLNEHLKVNFSEYVNNFRIEEAKERLTDPRFTNYTISSIAYDVGFNNKVSFNNAFKKITGITPSEYKFSKSPHFTN